MKLVNFSRFRALLEQEGDYIGGNDWTMDHEWANYKDHYNDPGSMDFDVDEPEEEDDIFDDDDNSSKEHTSEYTILRSIKKLGSRIKKLEQNESGY